MSVRNGQFAHGRVSRNGDGTEAPATQRGERRAAVFVNPVPKRAMLSCAFYTASHSDATAAGYSR
jgi:hypothetical protein